MNKKKSLPKTGRDYLFSKLNKLLLVDKEKVGNLNQLEILGNAIIYCITIHLLRLKAQQKTIEIYV